MAKKIETLYKEYDFENEDQYYHYIQQSYLVGQKAQVADLFNQMKKDSKLHFLNYFLGEEETDIEVRKYCIEQLLI